jgi:hypothetical protein
MVNAVSACTTFFPGEGLILYKPPLPERTGWAVETSFEESGINPQQEEYNGLYDRQGHLHRWGKKIGLFIDICC